VGSKLTQLTRQRPIAADLATSPDDQLTGRSRPPTQPLAPPHED